MHSKLSSSASAFGSITRQFSLLVLLVACCSAPALAADYLTSVTSDVYQTNGTPKEIATRASTCISQHLAPGTVDAQTIISSDLENGIVVARSAVEYPDFLIQWKIRSVFTFEAREGRFRIEQTNLERFNDRWDRIGKWTGSGWKKAEAAFMASADVVARCVTNPARKEPW